MILKKDGSHYQVRLTFVGIAIDTFAATIATALRTTKSTRGLTGLTLTT